EGDVQSDLDAVLLGPSQEAVKVLEGTELRVDGHVAALAGADAPGTAGIARPGGGRVILSLSKRSADGVDRRQVEHVEAHRRDVGQAGLHVLERAVPAWLRGRGAREQLVPRAVTGLFPIDHDREVLVV